MGFWKRLDSLPESPQEGMERILARHKDTWCPHINIRCPPTCTACPCVYETAQRRRMGKKPETSSRPPQMQSRTSPGDRYDSEEGDYQDRGYQARLAGGEEFSALSIDDDRPFGRHPAATPPPEEWGYYRHDGSSGQSQEPSRHSREGSWSTYYSPPDSTPGLDVYPSAEPSPTHMGRQTGWFAPEEHASQLPDDEPPSYEELFGETHASGSSHVYTDRDEHRHHPVRAASDRQGSNVGSESYTYHESQGRHGSSGPRSNASRMSQGDHMDHEDQDSRRFGSSRSQYQDDYAFHASGRPASGARYQNARSSRGEAAGFNTHRRNDPSGWGYLNPWGH